MGESLKLKVVTPEGSFIDREVKSFTAQSDRGEFCILPEHCLLLTSLVAGRMIVHSVTDELAFYALDSGFLEAGPDHVHVITENCVSADDIDATEIQSDVARLEQKLSDVDLDSAEGDETARSLTWATARLNVLEQNKN